jgi:hypothetical protein
MGELQRIASVTAARAEAAWLRETMSSACGFQIYLDEKLRQAHYQDLLREAEKRRLLAQLPRHRRSTIKRAAGKLGVLLLKLGAWLKQFEQSPTVQDDHA